MKTEKNVEFEITWPPPEPLLEELRKSFNELDFQTRIGEEPYEIETQVFRSQRLGSALFCAWLVSHGHDSGAEVLIQMADYFIEHVYLVNWSRQAALAKVTKPQIEQFLHLVEFNVTPELWDSGINPFDGLISFYQFLEDIGYAANLPRRKRAVAELRKRVIKRPCPMLPAGELTMQ